MPDDAPDLKKYQREAIDTLTFMRDGLQMPGAWLISSPGTGKTRMILELASTLTPGDVVVVVAPLKVVYNVWPAESAKWYDGKLKIHILHGKTQRSHARSAEHVNLLVLNPEGLKYFIDHHLDDSVKMIVLDESTLFKNWTTKRVKQMRKILATVDVFLVAMTGTPIPNGYADAYSQVSLLDGGERLGRTLTEFRKFWMRSQTYPGANYVTWSFCEEKTEKIERLIKSLVVAVDDSELELPELTTLFHTVKFSDDLLAAYKTFEKAFLFELKDCDTLTTFDAGSKYQLALQIIQGRYYVANVEGGRSVIPVHVEKLQALDMLWVDVIERKPAMIAYRFQYELEMLQSRFIDYDTAALHGDQSPAEAAEAIDLWNTGQLDLLFVQPQSCSHGLNLQSGPGRDLIIYSTIGSPENYSQLIKRIHRQGVIGEVRVHHLLVSGTLDHVCTERTIGKHKTDKEFVEALKNYAIGC